MDTEFSHTKTLAQEKFQSGLMDFTACELPDFGMAKPKEKVEEIPILFEPALIRAWRKHRKWTQEDLAAKAGMSPGNLSNLETGKQGYSQENLEALALALGCTVVELLVRDPRKPDDIFTLWAKASPAQRERILKVAGSLLEVA